MIWLVIFSTLSIVQVGYLWFQWDKISNIIEMTKLANKLIGSQLKDNKPYIKTMDFKSRVVMVIMNFKGLLWIPIILLIIVNLIVATILSGIISLVLLMF